MTYGIVVELDTGALLFYGIPFIIVVGWFSSRLLGVHRGWGRSFVAGFCGWIFGVSIAAFIENENIRNTHQLNHVLLLALFFGVLISMFVGLILDVILKPQVAKHHRYRWLLHPIATAKRKLAPLGRSREILRYAR
jgi:MFS family permease